MWPRFAPFLPATRLKSQRLWSSCASRCQRARGLRSCRLVSYRHKRSLKPTQWAGLACLAAPEICVKRRASGVQELRRERHTSSSGSSSIHLFSKTREDFNEHFAHGWARCFNENKLDDNAIWPWSSGIAAGTAHKQLRLQEHTPIPEINTLCIFNTLVYRLCRDVY